MRGIVNYCDYFVISSGTSERQVKAIADGIEEGLSKLGIKIKLKKGSSGARPKGYGVADDHDHQGFWMLMDMGDVVAHIFDTTGREFYGLEHLWHQAPQIPFEE